MVFFIYKIFFLLIEKMSIHFLSSYFNITIHSNFFFYDFLRQSFFFCALTISIFFFFSLENKIIIFVISRKTIVSWQEKKKESTMIMVRWSCMMMGGQMWWLPHSNINHQHHLFLYNIFSFHLFNLLNIFFFQL